ncbi:MAG: CDP-alcohol phosphatidyltransferase family protein [Alphaproteobacteria bacterium]|nr:CDP-alcohol phosphatidyltransferase family protein [Alphaproteobacteria bacterium]
MTAAREHFGPPVSVGAWIPNGLTLARLAAAPALLALAFGPWEADGGALLVLFALAALTDLADGALARALRAETEFGARLDPFADKALVLAGLGVAWGQGGLAGLHLVPVAAIALREALVAFWRVRAPARFAGSSMLSKAKTALQMLAVGLILAAPLAPQAPVGAVGLGALWIAALLALASLGRYAARAAAPSPEEGGRR